jgi:predicted AAA+ superfamily ATPase
MFMKRLIDYHLRQWKDSAIRQPLLVRGARQVGKTHAARELGKSFSSFVEINLEENEDVCKVFDGNLTAQEIVIKLEAATGKSITPGKTLLFLDEVQAAPRSILALRYLYEQMPNLHVIAAGSLLEFAIEQVGVPVGRVQFMYMYPLSFIEYLAAINKIKLIQFMLEHPLEIEMPQVFHDMLLQELGRYLALGGMPQVLQSWKENQKIQTCTQIQSRIIATYRQDFAKYARTKQIKYVELVFEEVPRQLSHMFKYSEIDGDYRKRDLAPALDLLKTAGVIHKVCFSPGQGIPLGYGTNPLDYKVLFIDVGIAQKMLDANLSRWFIDPLKEFINKGELVEAFIGLELIAYASPHEKKSCYYWHRQERTSQAEVDYLVQLSREIIPLEVKSGMGKNIKSMRTFLESHPQSPYGIKFSTHNFAKFDEFHSYPLYAVSKLLVEHEPELREAIEGLFDIPLGV